MPPERGAFLRPRGRKPRRRRGTLFRIHRRFCFLQRRCNCASGGSSSQASYPSPRRKRQVSSITLLVLSKQQTLRWFAVWSLILSQEKRWWRKECLGTRIALTREKTSHQILRIFVTLSVDRTPFGRRPHKLHIPRPAASGRSRPFRCSSSPNCKRFAGLQFGSACLARKSGQKEALDADRVVPQATE